MESPYQPPKAGALDVAKATRSKSRFGWAALLCGLGVVITPLIGIVGTIGGMVGAIDELNSTGTADPSALADDISTTMLSLFWGLLISLLSLIPFIIFLVLFLKQKKALRQHSLMNRRQG
jgi:flagellar motor component MotA